MENVLCLPLVTGVNHSGSGGLSPVTCTAVLDSTVKQYGAVNLVGLSYLIMQWCQKGPPTAQSGRL